MGTGLVTSEGALWNKQRTLISYALRVEILDDIVDIALRAVERLVRLLVCRRRAQLESGAERRALGRSQCVKLEKIRGTKQSIEISEEFRHLTLQVIGESILSMTPEESDSVFPHLYLPIMARFILPGRPVCPLIRLSHRKRAIGARWSRGAPTCSRRPGSSTGVACASSISTSSVRNAAARLVVRSANRCFTQA